MWLRWITMRWSMRWAMTSAVLLAISAVVVLAQWLQYPGRLPMWVVAVMVVASLGAGALAAALQRLQMAPYAAIAAALNSRQRAELAAMIKPGPLPADPRVLAAAARLRRLGRTRRVPRWRPWVVVGVMAAYGAWATTVSGTATVGVILLVWAAISAARVGWAQVRARQLAPRWAAVVAAADANPTARNLLDTTDDAPAVRDWRRWGCLIGAAIIFGGAYGIAFSGIRTAQARECRVASTVVNYIYQHKDLLDSERLTGSELSVSAYQQWAQQLADYATQAKASSFGPDLARVSDAADRIARTVDLVQESSPRPDQLSSEQVDLFARQVRQLLDVEQPLVTACR
ncbi:hypothetical protein ACQ86B_28975 (plasmid) [Mycolicibacterium aichiense]|uniref:hypothetical protein n=1 Tax=Mycolicibacterium aichiense TaxID=1799 RepID=UPI003D674A24